MFKRNRFILLIFYVNFLYVGFVYNNSTEFSDCPTLANADNLSQTQLLERLTHVCRYDRFERPVPAGAEEGVRPPVDVFVRAYVYFMQNLEAHDLQFKIYALLQLRFIDHRLIFRKVAPTRKQPILGEEEFRVNLWMPHIFLANERDSSILGTTNKNILTSVSPDGTVIISSRIQATLYCWMNLKKFPFDEQFCPVVIESWIFNTSELVLHWEQKRPITFDPKLHLTEYLLREAWSNETVINADLNDLRHGAFAGNYSSLSFTVNLTRVVGYYIMGYFFPSLLIVGISWVSFWLQADQVGPRIMLGTSTMLTFITLATAQGKTLPKVSYIKVSEIWFMGCTSFIFGSLLEFAFVNTIWLRNRNVAMKKINSKNIIKSTLTSPRLKRCNSFSALTDDNSGRHLWQETSFGKNHIQIDIPLHYQRNMSSVLSPATSLSMNDLRGKCPEPQTGNNFRRKYGVRSHPLGWTTLTPQEIAMWIDRKARFWFPLAFLIFNLFFWIFVSF